MSSRRPYLIRAMYEWIVDNGRTPHLVVLADYPGTVVPREYVDEGRIVFNIGPSAVRDLSLGNDRITFTGRFSGTPMFIDVPVPAAVAIYARENGQGMVFAPEDEPPPPEPGPDGGDGGDDGDKGGNGGQRPRLRVVK